MKKPETSLWSILFMSLVLTMYAYFKISNKPAYVHPDTIMETFGDPQAALFPELYKSRQAQLPAQFAVPQRGRSNHQVNRNE